MDPAENPDRQGSGEQTVEEALYVIGGVSPSWWLLLRSLVSGKNILGRNVTNRLLPVATQLTRGLGLVGHVTEAFHHRYLNRFFRFGSEHVEDKRKIPYLY